MARSGKSKTVDEHIKDGTYRQDRHGITMTNSDFDKLQEMKKTLYDNFVKTSTELNNIDKKKDPDNYKKLNSVMIEQIKSFLAISKHKITPEENGEKDNGKIKISI